MKRRTKKSLPFRKRVPMHPELSLARKKDLIEKELSRVLSREDSDLYRAMRYAVLGGGKRFRPLLLFASGACFKVPSKILLPFACALELIHNYSLIHDDLPSMDDDDFRRGQPSCHKAFGEGIALLAGDGLLTLAFEIMAGAGMSEERLGQKGEAIQILSRAAGVSGMIGGQFLDITMRSTELTAKKLEELILKKTGALIVAAVEIGAVLGGARMNKRKLLVDFGQNIGLAFQVRDDILDFRKSRKRTGPQCPDAATFLGVDRATKRLNELIRRAIGKLDEASLEAPELRWLALSLLTLKEGTAHG